ncbi:MAG: FKBP-type peptidyl-prolyl cis-trans isomerase [Oscillospiraceae bacterium]|nr:FKBP-type peptidyl-prolyl cis-trans isomerase [Oscillospiraceae bacterium]
MKKITSLIILIALLVFAAACAKGNSASGDSDKLVENGDIVNIDFVGMIDGEPFENGSDEGFDLTIGSGRFIPGFEEQMIGMKNGETKDLNVPFPEDYGVPELAGKEAVFRVTVNYIQVKDTDPARTAAKGDTVNIDFIGMIDGEPFENGSAEDVNLNIGSERFIPGFEDQVIGMKTGETKDINVTFPEDYGVPELDGKEVVFKVTLNYFFAGV